MVLKEAFDKASRIEIFYAVNHSDVVVVFFGAEAEGTQRTAHATAIFEGDTFDHFLNFMIQLYPNIYKVDKR